MTTSLISCPACAKFFAASTSLVAPDARPLCPACSLVALRDESTRQPIAAAPTIEAVVEPQRDALTQRTTDRRTALRDAAVRVEVELCYEGILTPPQLSRLAMIGALHAVGIAHRQVVLISGPTRSGTSRIARALIRAASPNSLTIVEIHAPTMVDRLHHTPAALASLLSNTPAEAKSLLIDEIGSPVSGDAPWVRDTVEDRVGMFRLLRHLLLAPALQDLDGRSIGLSDALFVLTTSMVLDETKGPEATATTLIRAGMPDDLAGVLSEQVVTLGEWQAPTLEWQLRTHGPVAWLIHNAEQQLGLRLVVPDATYSLLARRRDASWTVESAAAVLMRAIRSAIEMGMRNSRAVVVIGPDDVIRTM